MADENKKGITVKIDAALHAQVKEYIESRGMTMAEFITAACDDLLHPKITEKEDKKMENMRTVAFQVPESLFQRIKDYLQRNNMTQRQFLLGLIEAELDQDLTEREANAILTHMFPLSAHLPRCREAAVVNLADKICATIEVAHLYRTRFIQRLLPAAAPA